MKKHNSTSEPTGPSLIAFAMKIPGAEGIKRSLKKQDGFRECFFLVCSFLSLIVDSRGKKLCRTAPAFFGKKGGSACPVARMVYSSMIEVGATSLSVRDFCWRKGMGM